MARRGSPREIALTWISLAGKADVFDVVTAFATSSFGRFCDWCRA
jgi:hypothetical protein